MFLIIGIAIGFVSSDLLHKSENSNIGSISSMVQRGMESYYSKQQAMQQYPVSVPADHSISLLMPELEKKPSTQDIRDIVRGEIETALRNRTDEIANGSGKKKENHIQASSSNQAILAADNYLADLIQSGTITSDEYMKLKDLALSVDDENSSLEIFKKFSVAINDGTIVPNPDVVLY